MSDCISIRNNAIKGMVDRGGVTVTIYNATPCSGDNLGVSNELQQFNNSLNGDNTIDLTGNESIIGQHTDWTLIGNEIVADSVVVTDSSGVSGYNEGTDYTVDYDLAIITRVVTGAILDLEIVKIHYAWHFDCIDEKTGSPNRLCTSCIDTDQGTYPTGVIYTKETTMKALFHIPTYNSPFEKVGVWKLGDAVITVPYNVQVNANNYEDGGFFCQDKIKVQGQPGILKVMSMPQTITMGEFLGKRIHCRKIDF